jgi:hypothetical protein
MTDANGYDDRPYDPRSALAAEQLGDLDPALDPAASAKMTPWRDRPSARRALETRRDKDATMARSARRPADALNPRPGDVAAVAAEMLLGDDPAPAMVPWRTQESHTSRAYTYEAITSVLGRDVRVTVYRESVDYQSYACAEMLTPSGWQPLDRLLDPSIWHSSYASTTAALRRHAEDDRVELLATAAQLIAHLPS